MAEDTTRVGRGVFVLGVSDKTRKVVGIPLERLDAVVQRVRDICMDSIEPALEHVVVDRLRLPAGTGEEVAVVKVDVPRSLFVHRSPGGYMHRVADSKRTISPSLLARLFNERGEQHLTPFDEQAVPGALVEDDHLGQQHGAFRQRAGDQSVRPLGTAADDLCGVWQWTVVGATT